LKTQRDLSDSTLGSGLPLANFPLNIQIGFGGLAIGPSPNAGLSFRQSNHQVKYDGSKTSGPHIIRFGFNFNRIGTASFVPFGSLAPQLFTGDGRRQEDFAQKGPFPGGNTNPLNYPVQFVQLSNGLGYLTPVPGLGLPASNFLYHRFAVYVGASSKWRRNLTLTYGVRYVRETGRSDSEFPAIPELNALIPGLGNRVRQPNLNFSPQFGFAWDPSGKGKTVVRGGVGLFYENVPTSVDPQDPSLRAPLGNVFIQAPAACQGVANPQSVPTPTGTLQPTFCGTPGGDPIAIGSVANQIVAFQKQYQADFPLDLHSKNPNYLGTLLSQGQGANSPAIAPDYRTPRSFELNIGVQREIRPGMVLTADYVRNVQTHYLMAIDENHAGDVRYFNKAAALEAVAATNQSFGCGKGTDFNSIQCAISAGAQMARYARNGLTSSFAFNQVCSFSSATVPGGTYGCAFPGIYPNAPPLQFFEPIGRSVYDGLQTKFTQNVQHPFRGLRALNFQVSYALSRFENSGGASPFVPINSDQDFGVGALDNASPTASSDRQCWIAPTSFPSVDTRTCREGSNLASCPISGALSRLR